MKNIKYIKKLKNIKDIVADIAKNVHDHYANHVEYNEYFLIYVNEDGTGKVIKSTHWYLDDEYAWVYDHDVSTRYSAFRIVGVHSLYGVEDDENELKEVSAYETNTWSHIIQIDKSFKKLWKRGCNLLAFCSY